MRVAGSLIGLVCLSSCILGGDPVGEGEKATAGFRQASSVLVALESFRAERGEYPDSLGQLVPELLSQEQLTLSIAEVDLYPFEYERLGPGFALRFRYVGPGMNECTFDRAAMAWDCVGYY